MCAAVTRSSSVSASRPIRSTSIRAMPSISATCASGGPLPRSGRPLRPSRSRRLRFPRRRPTRSRLHRAPCPLPRWSSPWLRLLSRSSNPTFPQRSGRQRGRGTSSPTPMRRCRVAPRRPSAPMCLLTPLRGEAARRSFDPTEATSSREGSRGSSRRFVPRAGTSAETTTRRCWVPMLRQLP